MYRTIRNTISMLLVFASLISVPSICFAEQIPNVMKGSGQEQQVVTGNCAENGRELINSTADKGKIQMPNAESYFDSPQIKFVDVPKKNSAYAYRQPKTDKDHPMSWPYHGIKVLAVAEQAGFDCVIYHFEVYQVSNFQRVLSI